MQGPFYLDILPPFFANQGSSVTLSTTFKALHIAAAAPALGGGYFNYVGKRIKIKGFGRMTTAATPGNVQMALFWGTGADLNGTNLGNTATQALSTTQTNKSFEFEFDVICTAINTAAGNGSLLALGKVIAAESLWAPHLLLPDQTAAAVSVDLSANNVLSVQMSRSGSTAETAQLHDLHYIAAP